MFKPAEAPLKEINPAVLSAYQDLVTIDTLIKTNSLTSSEELMVKSELMVTRTRLKILMNRLQESGAAVDAKEAPIVDAKETAIEE